MKSLLRVLSKIVVFILIIIVLLLLSCKIFKNEFACNVVNFGNSSNRLFESKASIDSRLNPSLNEIKLFELLENGKDFIVLRAPDELSQSMTYVLPGENGYGDYVLTWQDGNIMQWKDVSSIGNVSEVVQIVASLSDKISVLESYMGLSGECIDSSCNTYDVNLQNRVVGVLQTQHGGTGSSMESPGEDRILFWDDSAGKIRWLKVGDNLEIYDRTLDAEGGLSSSGTSIGGSYTGEIYTSGNGLSVSGSEVQLGGTLSKNTTITQGNQNMIFNLTGTGDFDVQDSGVSILKITDAGLIGVGISSPESFLDIRGSTPSTSSLRVRSGSTPLTPVSGDVYSDGTNIYFWNGSSWDDLTEVGSAGETLPTGFEGQFLYNNSGTWEAFNGLFWDDGSSYLGLGTTDPQYALDIIGTTQTTTLRTSNLYLSGTQITASASELNILDGALVSTSELNLLVGRSGTLIDTNNISSYAVTPADIGNYSVTSIIAGSGLSQTSSGPGQVTLDIGAGNGILLNADSLSLQIATSGSFTSGSSFSGLELNSSGLSLLGGCSDDEVLAWDTDTQSWMCSSKLALGGVTGSGSGVSTEGQVAFWNGGSTITGSNDFWFESSSGRLGIGTTSPVYNLHVVGSVAASDYFSSLGNAGATSNISGMVFENGLYISGTIAGFLTPSDIGVLGGVQGYNAETSFLGQTIELSSSEISGILPVSFGGTGAGSFTENSLLLGSGTGPLGSVAVGQDGQILLGVTGSGPVFGTLSGDATVSNSGVLTLLSTSVVSGSYGSSIYIPQITVDEKGRLTGVTEIDIASSLLPIGAEGQMIYSNSGTWVAFDGLFWNDGSLSLGIGTTNPQSKLDVNGDLSSTSIFTQTFYLSGTQVEALASELNVLNGILASTSELNTLAGATISTSELNVLTGILASTSELNVLNGILASTSELNVLNGILASTSELNLLAGRTGTLIDTDNIGTYAVTSSNASGYVITSITAGSGLSISSTGPGNVILDIGAGNGVSVLDDSISLNLVTSGSSSSRSSLSGLEISSRGLSLIQGCTDDEVLSWDSANGWWECSSKLGGGAVAIDGSPLDNQLAVWSGGGTSIKDSNLWFVSDMLGIGTSAPEYGLEVAGSLMALDFFSSDGTPGLSTTVSGLTFKNGLYTSGTITGFLTSESYLGTVTSITAGSGMDFSDITGSGSITLGTPSSVSSTSTNLVSGTTHTHAITSYALTDTSDITFSGSPEILGSGSASASLATISGLVSGTYGTSTLIPVFSVDAKGRVISASSIVGDFQASSSTLSALSALSYADGNVIVGNGTTWVVESGATARTTLGLGSSDSPDFAGLYLSGTQVTSNAAELNILDGVNLTLSASELNVLDGIAAGLPATEQPRYQEK